MCLGKQLQKVKGNRLKLMAMNYFQTAPYIVKACGVAGVVEATCLDTVADMCLCHILEVETVFSCLDSLVDIGSIRSAFSVCPWPGLVVIRSWIQLP